MRLSNETKSMEDIDACDIHASGWGTWIVSFDYNYNILFPLLFDMVYMDSLIVITNFVPNFERFRLCLPCIYSSCLVKSFRLSVL